MFSDNVVKFVLPVLDVMHGHVVRGVAGQRSNYQPLVSQWTASTSPLAVATALQSKFGFDEFYLADLDAILGGAPAIDTFAQLQAAGLKIWVDAGVRTVADAKRLSHVERIIVGLETLASPEELHAILNELGSDRVVFSLDLKAGKTLGNLETWPNDDPGHIADHAIGLGIRHVIVLDLADVGVGTGTRTLDLCARLHRQFPEVALIAGGGVRSWDDVRSMVALGISRALVASALHDGRL